MNTLELTKLLKEHVISTGFDLVSIADAKEILNV